MSAPTKGPDLTEAGGPFAGVTTRLRVESELDPLPESKVLSPLLHDDWPDPPAREAFIGIAGELVSTLDPHTEADPVAVLAQFLIAVGNMIGRGPHFRVESDTHHLNNNVVLVGQTAKGRKGTSWGHVQRLLSQVDEHWERNRIASGLSSGEGLIWAVRDPIEQQQPVREKGRVVRYEPVRVDAGESDKRLLVLESEFSAPLRVMSREGNTLSAVIRNAWDGLNLRTLTKNSPAVATDPHVSIIGHGTREELRRHLPQVEMANGFANRFLWVSARRSKKLPEGGAVEDRALSDLRVKLTSAVAAACRIGRITRDGQAGELWRAVYPELSEGGAGLLGAVTSRAEAHVMRLACIYAALDGTATLRVEHLQAALALWRYCADSARHVFGIATESTTADATLNALRLQPAGMTRTEIRDFFQRHKPRAEVDAALAELERTRLAFSRDEPTGGRPVERWFASVANVASVAAADRSLSTSPDTVETRDECDLSDGSPPQRVGEAQS